MLTRVIKTTFKNEEFMMTMWLIFFLIQKYPKILKLTILISVIKKITKNKWKPYFIFEKNQKYKNNKISNLSKKLTKFYSIKTWIFNKKNLYSSLKSSNFIINYQNKHFSHFINILNGI